MIAIRLNIGRTSVVKRTIRRVLSEPGACIPIVYKIAVEDTRSSADNGESREKGTPITEGLVAGGPIEVRRARATRKDDGVVIESISPTAAALNSDVAEART